MAESPKETSEAPSILNWSLFGGIFGSDSAAPSPNTSNAFIPRSPKKKKRHPTKDELQLVLDHHKLALDKDIESILLQHEAHVIHHRDKIYAEAKENGITSKSADHVRLAVLMAVIRYIYTKVKPPNEYTQKTDVSHYKEVAVWATKYAKEKGIIAPLTLIYASWTHDLERWIPSIKCAYLPENVDPYRKQIIHGITSAKLATYLLKGGPITEEECERIYDLILYHDMPYPQKDIVILGQKLISGASDDLMWEEEILMDADAICFFKYTIFIFIEHKSKSKSPEWIWERVTNNVHRLRPHLIEEAVKSISALPQELKSKMEVNYVQLDALRAKYQIEIDQHKDESGYNLDCRSRCLILSTFSVTIFAMLMKQYLVK